MPTEVGISLALRRHNSLIKSHQDSGRRISSKQKSGNSDDNDDNGDNGSGNGIVGGDGEYDNGLEYRRLTQQDDYQQQREQVSQSEGTTHTFRYKNGNNGNKRRLRRNSRTTSNTRERKKNGSSTTSIAQSIKKKRPLSSTATATSSTVAASAEPPENSWHVLRDGMLIYISCMVLPTVVRWCLVVVVRNNRLSQSVVRKLCGASSPKSSSLSSATLMGWLSSILPSCQNSLLWEEMTLSVEDDISTTGIDTTETSTSVLAPDAGLSDFAIVGFLALFFASLRIILMYLLVPKLSEPKRMAALVRCKSIHLLSGSYQGSMTPVRPSPRLLLSDLHKLPDLPNLYGAEEETDSVEPKPPLMPDLDQYTAGTDQTKIINHNESLKRQIEDQEEDEDEWFSGDAAAEEDNDENEEEGEMVDDEGEENQPEAPIVQSGLLSKSSALSLTQLLEQASGHQPPVPSVNGRMSRRNSASSRLHEETDDNAGGGRVYAAPKYATAIFRLLFCLMSSLTAYVSFVKAEWWPPILLGHGSTLNCWSLSSVGLAMDADFDLYNTALRRYYLIQASYHVHSAAFHIFTSMLLWFVSKSSRRSSQYGKGEGSVFRFYNIHTFFRHCFSIGLILVTYLFSSTRRLGAIAMFALDLSNIPLHVLQIRINAPTQSRIPIRFLHALVLLSFCFLRIYVCIFVIAFSALEESQSSGWLEQLSSMQSGVANAMKGVFVIGFIFYLVLTAVYFIRLVTHSHVQEKVLAQDRTSN